MESEPLHPNDSELTLQELGKRAIVEIGSLAEEMQVLRLCLDICPWPMWIKRLEALPDGTTAFRMMRINSAYENRWGISKDAYQGKLDSEIWPPDIAASFRDHDLQAVKCAPNHLYTTERVPDQLRVIDGAISASEDASEVPTWRIGKGATQVSRGTFVVGIAWRESLDEIRKAREGLVSHVDSGG